MTHELEINGTVYNFKFGFGFLRTVNKMVKTPVQGVPGMEKEVGLKYVIAALIDGEPETLAQVLFIANEGLTPRLTRAKIDEFLEDENTDIDKVFEQVIDFLRTANVSKRAMREIMEAVKGSKNQ